MPTIGAPFIADKASQSALTSYTGTGTPYITQTIGGLGSLSQAPPQGRGAKMRRGGNLCEL